MNPYCIFPHSFSGSFSSPLPRTFTNTLSLPSPVTQIWHPLLTQKKIQLFIKRDELIHPVIQGNKWRKLKYNLAAAQQHESNTILSFGGAYSNHLHALAYAGKQLNINTIGVIRGEAPSPLNPCLQDMQDWGMQLRFIKRIEYKHKHRAEFIQKLHDEVGGFYLIPEGGDNNAGKKGCAELLTELQQSYDIICCEIGSGTMFSSLIQNNTSNTQFLGFAVMKNPQLDQDIRNSLTDSNDHKKTPTIWSVNHDYHFGGFAKTTDELNIFIENFKADHDIQLEPVYSAKLLWGIFDLINKDYFKTGSTILAIHGGGLQGLRGFDTSANTDK